MTWFRANSDQVFHLLFTHVWLSALPIVLGFLIALPIGWYANRHPRLRGVVLGLGSVLFTIPSLAFFVLLPTLIGTSILAASNVVIALTIYAVAIMVRSATDAFASVSPAVLDSATATGFAPRGLAFVVELPLAGPVLLAGLRVVAVSTVSLVSVGALIGVNNLGSLFTEGSRTDNQPEVLIGLVLVVGLALVYDALLVVAGRLLMPWASASRTTSRNPMSPVMAIAQRLRGGAA